MLAISSSTTQKATDFMKPISNILKRFQEKRWAKLVKGRAFSLGTYLASSKFITLCNSDHVFLGRMNSEDMVFVGL